MEKTKNLLKSALIYTIGSLGSRILVFSLVPLFSFYLSKKDLGMYDLMLTTISLFVPFVTIQISDATYRWLLTAKDEIDKVRAITNGLAILTSSVLCFTLIYIVVSKFIDLQYIGYFSLMLILGCYLPFFQQVIRGLGKNKFYAAIGIVNALLVVLFNVFFIVVLKLKVESLFIASIISSAVTLVVILFFGKLNIFIKKAEINLLTAKEMITYSWPMVPNQISWWLINASDRYLILYLLGQEFNGIYAISSRLPGILTIINGIFILAWQDQAITEKKSEDDGYASKMFDMYMTFELSMVLVFISVCQLFVKYAIDEKFYSSYQYMPLLFLGVGYSAFAGYVGAIFLKEKKTKVIFYSSIIAGITNVIISFSLMKVIGLYAVALGTFISFLLMFILRLKQGKAILNMKIDYFKMSALTILCIVFGFLINIDFLWLKIMMILISLVIFAVLNGKIFVKLAKLVLRKKK